MGFRPKRWLVGLIFLVGAALIGGFLGFPKQSDQSSIKSQTVFVVKKGESLDQIALRLKERDLIQSPFAFKFLVLTRGLSKSIQAGSFHLRQGMTSGEIADQLTHGTLDIWITFLEGWRNEQVAQKLMEEGFNIDIESWNLEIKDLGYEGYLFPDTYLFPESISLGAVIEIMRDNLDRKFDARLKRKMDEKKLTFHQVMTLASVVEREVRTEKDRPLVAGILVKRWQNDWPLQADATVQYAVASSQFLVSGFRLEDWWPKNLTRKDLEIDSPFNTYRYKGLPPGPICNPGLESIQAVVEWQESPYWFYLSDAKGKIHYAGTIEGHHENIARFLGK